MSHDYQITSEYYNQDMIAMLKKATWPLFTLSKKKNKIDTNPDYQRPAVRTKAKKEAIDRFYFTRL